MTLPQLWLLTRRWLWLLVLTTLLAAGVSFLVSRQLPRVYEGSAKLLVTPGQGSTGAATYNDVLTAERLTRTYSEVIKTRPVVEEAARQTGLVLSYEDASRLLDVRPLRDTQLVQITARANDPDLAARFANQVARVFIDQTQASQSSRFAASKEALGRQVDALAADIAQRTRQLDELRTQPASAARDGNLARLQSEITQLQQSYGSAVRSYEDIRVSEARSSDLLAVVEPASPARAPVEPRTLLNVILAGVVGLFVAAGAVFLLEYLDDRLQTPERVTRFTGLHTLGAVARLPREAPRTLDLIPVPRAGEGGHGYAASSAAEAFRLLRANLQFAAVDRPLRTILVTSAEAGEGKTTTAANLAVVLAQSGQHVLLVDADLRRPSQHTVFGVPNRAGLTSLLVDESREPVAVVVATRVPGLQLLPSGPLPPNPSELLASARMRRRLEQLQAACDVVVIDSPPVLAVSDPAILGGLVDGTVLVVNAQSTRGAHAAQAVAMLQKAGATMLGAVVNRVAPSGGGYYGYYSQNYESRPSEPPVVSHT